MKPGSGNSGSAGLLFLPYLMGERAPIWNANASGVFLGVRNYHSATHFVKAFMEGICMALNQVGEKLESKLSFDKIHVSGGITNSEEWMQMIANVFNKEVYQQATVDASALGAAYLANHNIKRDQKVLNIFYPQPAPHLVYKKLNTVFQSLYTKLKPEMNILFSLANQ
jgi:gluconokinase